MSKSNKKHPIVFYVGLVLACLVLISTHFTSGLYARYISTVSASDAARVAKFQITDTLAITDSEGNAVNVTVVADSLIPGERTTYAFSVVNNSEVTVNFSVRGEAKIGNLPLTMTPVTVQLAPDESKNVEFAVVWDAAKNDPAYGDMIELIDIIATAEQVD